MNEIKCADCKLRTKFDEKPKSLMGRFWRWHIGFCPGWKAYMASLNPEERKNIKAQYSITT